ncbi:MAG: hypothetical protein NWP80_00005, partial [Candidatus Gracilibacteria bacterium]|nr:hypothetical protein [Candidatus Gracilibacteria bacterium]
HKQAAGFSISKEKYEIFKNEITNELNQIDFSVNQKIINIDKIIDITQLGFNLFESIQEFKPFGIGNPKPIFMFEDFIIDGVEYLGKTKEHITLKNKYGIKLVGFNIGDYYDKLKGCYKLNIIFELDVNIWMGKRSLSCRVIDFFD